MEGLLLESLEGLEGNPVVGASAETWEWLQSEKEAVAREILSAGRLSQTAVGEVQEAGAQKKCGGE